MADRRSTIYEVRLKTSFYFVLWQSYFVNAYSFAVNGNPSFRSRSFACVASVDRGQR